MPEQSYEALVVEEGFLVEVTEQVIVLMTRSGVTQMELAARMDCSQPMVSMLLSGDREMTLRWLWRIALALGCKLTVSLEARKGAGPA